MFCTAVLNIYFSLWVMQCKKYIIHFSVFIYCYSIFAYTNYLLCIRTYDKYSIFSLLKFKYLLINLFVVQTEHVNDFLIIFRLGGLALKWKYSPFFSFSDAYLLALYLSIIYLFIYYLSKFDLFSIYVYNINCLIIRNLNIQAFNSI